jgi:iron complex transport system ATP-binding protein
MSHVLGLSQITHVFDRKPAVEAVDLTVSAGEVVAIVGPNGSGKSTLLRIAAGVLRPTSGRCVWFGREMPRRDLARRLAYLPQNPSFAAGQTVAQTVAAGRAPHWRAFGCESTVDAAAVASAVRLARTPPIDRPVDALSGGERSRVFLARALAQVDGATPGVLLLDEPDAALDLVRAAAFADLLRTLAVERGLAIVLTTHDLATAARCADRILLLASGLTVALGPPEEVLTEDLVSAAYGERMRWTKVLRP